MMEHVDHVPFSPYAAVSAVNVEESVVSVLTFRDVPFIEIFAHHHKAHFIAELDELLGRHVVGCPDSVAAHVLEDGELTADGCLADRGSERAEVVVEAYSAELACLAVEEEALVRTYLYGSESEACADLVLEIFSMSDAEYRSCQIPVGVD